MIGPINVPENAVVGMDTVSNNDFMSVNFELAMRCKFAPHGRLY